MPTSVKRRHVIPSGYLAKRLSTLTAARNLELKSIVESAAEIPHSRQEIPKMIFIAVRNDLL